MIQPKIEPEDPEVRLNDHGVSGSGKDYPPSPMKDMGRKWSWCQEIIDESIAYGLLKSGREASNIRYEIVPNDLKSFQPGLNVRPGATHHLNQPRAKTFLS